LKFILNLVEKNNNNKKKKKLAFFLRLRLIRREDNRASNLFLISIIFSLDSLPYHFEVDTDHSLRTTNMKMYFLFFALYYRKKYLLNYQKILFNWNNFKKNFFGIKKWINK